MSPFVQFLRLVQILILKILNVFLRLKSSPSLNLNKIEPFSKVSKRILTIAIISLLVFSSCAWLEPKEEKSIQELASSGMDEFKKENYKTAIEYFEKLRDWYPFSKYAILAELKIADSYYKLKDYEEAISAYEEFVNLHPRNEAIAYVIYQTGLCYFEQIDTVDRDQTTAQKALDVFKKLVKQFPENAYANRARVKLKKCLKSLAGHEFYVGLFYYKSKRYKAALSRFEAVLNNYPDVGVQHKALQYLALCKESIAKETTEE
ncbi:MAG: outer membrane protein assembly factor BamD [Desulfobacteraceae bacterium]|nr:outer membrane protein assembly factor BamD [Desulfobacteraceae bacterium]